MRRWIGLMLVWMVLPAVLCGAERGGSLFLKPTDPEVLAGIPVVVELGWTNTTPAEIKVPPLQDTFWDHQKWTWISPAGDAWTIPFDHLHYRAIPQPAPVVPQSLAAGATVSWYATVPAPEALKAGDRWTLRLDQRLGWSETRVVTETVFTAAPSVSVETPRVPTEASWLQAALMEFPREDVLTNPVLTEEFWGILPARAEARDLRAKLVLFSRALKDNQKVNVTFRALENSPAPAQMLRDYLLFQALERGLSLQTNDDRALFAAQTPGIFMAKARKHLGKSVPQVAPKNVGARPTTPGSMETVYNALMFCVVLPMVVLMIAIRLGYGWLAGVGAIGLVSALGAAIVAATRATAAADGMLGPYLGLAGVYGFIVLYALLRRRDVNRPTAEQIAVARIRRKAGEVILPLHGKPEAGTCWCCGAPDAPPRRIPLTRVINLFFWVASETYEAQVPLCEKHSTSMHSLPNWVRILSVPFGVLAFIVPVMIWGDLVEQLRDHSTRRIFFLGCLIVGIGVAVAMQVWANRRQTFRLKWADSAAGVMAVRFHDPALASKIQHEVDEARSGAPMTTNIEVKT